ncbi:MAG: hypothetical protein WC886_08770, partial [Saccharofermentanaceae bacterium]
MKKIIFILLSVSLFVACERKIDEFSPSANGVNFTKFVAVGNSMVAGFADNALYLSGQQNSIPNLVAEQLKTVGAGPFVQPLIGTEEGVGVTAVTGGFYCYTKMALKIVPDKDCNGDPIGTSSIRPAIVNTTVDQNTLKQQLLAAPTVAGPYDNFGVPGVNVKYACVPGYGAYNPYFARFASSAATSSVIGEAAGRQPTFFMIWLGDMDALASATSGTDLLLTP